MSELTELQRETLHLFFGLPESSHFILAGGAALLAQDLTDRPTYDLDFFSSPREGAVADAASALHRAMSDRGWQVTVIQEAPTFCRLQVAGMGDMLIIDLAVDSMPIRAVIETEIGPSYDPLELAGRKLLALFGRAEARDFADVYRLAKRFGRSELLDCAAEVDLGFDRAVLAQMMRSLDRFTDHEVPVPSEEIEGLRAYFRDWATSLES